jgi:16S rRNA (uracil1498-N3)-methyltransferase
MRISRIYLPIEMSLVPQTLCISGEKAHYIKNVLRLKPSQVLHFFTPSGHQYQAIIASISKHEIQLIDVEITSSQTHKSTLTTTIAQGISSSDRMDYTIQKAAELGCTKLIPFISDFCSQKIPVHKFDKKQQHWQAVAISASEQSGRTDIMQIEPISDLNSITAQVNDGIYLDPTARQTLNQLSKNLQTTQTFIIGPEGGFSLEELDGFQQVGYIGIQLGQRVLRTETVAPVIMGAMHALYGDFKQPVV